MFGRSKLWFSVLGMAGLLVWLAISVGGASASISGVSGDVSLISPPASVQYGALESNKTIAAFDEQQCVALPADLPVDITSPGTYHVSTSLTKGTLAAGMKVSSHFVHADQSGRLKPFTDYDGSITVDEQIVGIEVRKATLDGSDFLGAPGTLYPTGAFGRGLELKPTSKKADYITLSPDLHTVSFHLQVALHVDQIRVLTECAPPPPPKATIVVKKLTVPSGDPAQFSFTGDLAGSIGDGGTISKQVDAGSYTTTETVPAGWSLTSISCDDAGSSGNLGTATATYNVAAGQTVTCTYTDTKAPPKATIVVKKLTVPSGDPAQFSFTGDLAGSIGDGGTISKQVDAGSYTTTETVPAGWSLTSISCDDAGSSGNLGTATATYHVSAGQTVTCTYTDTKAATIVVKKLTVPSGDPAKFSFTGDLAGSIGDGGTISKQVDAGTYSTTETVPSGWSLTSISCDDAGSSGNLGTATATYHVSAGQTVTCTYTDAKAATIVVKKLTVPSGDPTKFSFTGDLAGSIGDGGTISKQVDAGTYSTTETVPAGWSLTSISCDDAGSSGNLGTATATYHVAAGQTVTCTYTDAKAATIVVKKLTVPSGDPAKFTFSGDLAGSIGDGGAISKQVDAGTYSTTETVPSGWSLTSISCDDAGSSGNLGTATATYHVSAGQTVTCTYTDTKAATIVVKKLTVPSGDPTKFSFTGDLAGSIGDGGTISKQVDAGTYSTTETVPSGWSLTSISCDDAGSSGNLGTATATYHVAAGQTVTCTYTDTKPTGTPLTIGFWKNWSSCGGSKGNQTFLLDQVLTKTGGIALSNVFTVKTCAPAVAILDKSTIDNGKKMASDPAFNMAAQLLAAKLNVANGAKICSAEAAAVANGTALLSAVGFTGLSTWSDTMSAAQKASANTIESTLDSYNNGTLC